MTTNACADWDFTLGCDAIAFEELKTKLGATCKKWHFQKEKGEKTGYLHYQGRVSLKIKNRKGPNITKGIRWSPTVKENMGILDYVTKEHTRIEGPWAHDDPEVYIPRQYRNIKLYKWQESIKGSANIPDDRKIDLIYDPEGNKGKSTIASICELLYNGIDMPPLNDFKELIALTCDICMERNTRDPKIVFFDLPRALDKDRLNGLYSAIEQIKKGKLYDCRYKYKSWWIDSPRCWVFSNHLPDQNLLSNDRWNIWTIDQQSGLLQRYVAPNLDDGIDERFLGGKPVTIAKKRIL